MPSPISLRKDPVTPQAASIEFADNPEPRCACVLLLDTSGSMSGTPIQELNQAMVEFKNALAKDTQASARVEVAVVTFGEGGVTVAQEFVSAGDFVPPTLIAGGLTPLGDALNQTLDLVVDRKATYKANAVDYYRPWIILITDGAPTDTGAWEAAAARLRAEENRKGVLCWCFGVDNADTKVLKGISSERSYLLKDYAGSFGKIFRWVSSSMARVSQSTPGDQVPLEAPPGPIIIS
jgi:uncharacterized protein YegL